MVTGGLYLVQLFQCAQLSVFNQARREEWGPFPKGLSKKVGQHLPSPSSKISQLEEGSCHKFFTFFFRRSWCTEKEKLIAVKDVTDFTYLVTQPSDLSSQHLLSVFCWDLKKERKRLKMFLLLSCMSTNGQLLLLWFTQILTMRNGKYYNKYNGS